MQALSSRNGKSRECLSLDGMAAHVAKATPLMRRGVRTESDWKLAIVFILRAYHQEFTKKVAHEFLIRQRHLMLELERKLRSLSMQYQSSAL